ncbi:hypothetical protein KSP40_PGU022667 [Platanthera guangdongensis]|uniref:Myb-like domain-containing protein n=1 Tax=Platanthera guangdongensis TaxID=2320717 RepID=A0ABR2N2P0_9ASPA
MVSNLLLLLSNQLELVTSNPLEGINSFIEMTCDQKVDKSLGSLSVSNRDNQADLVNVVRNDEVDISALGTRAILSKPCRNSDEHVEKFQTDLQDRTKSAESNSSGAAGPVFASNLDYSISEPISVPSELVVRQSSLVTNGYATNIEASDLSLRHTEVGNEPAIAVSSVEHLDDLFLQSDQSAGKQIGKCRPKPSLCVKKGKKVKSVTFMLPNNGVEPPAASAECQSKLVTSSPLKTTTSFVGMLSDQNMDEIFSSLSTSNIENQVDLDEIDLSAIDTLDIISDPNCNSDEHVEKFQTGLLGTRNCAESNPATCRVPITPSGTASGYSQLDSSDSLGTHSPHFLVDDLIESYEERACAGNNNDLVDQSFVEHEDIHNMEGANTTNYIEEPNLEECAPNTVQNDETGKSSTRVRQRNRKLKSSVVDNMGSGDQNAKDGISGMDEDYDGEHHMDEDMLKEKKTKARRNSCSRSSENESSPKSSKKASGKPDSTNKDPPKKRLPRGSRSKSAKRQVNKAYLEIPDDELDRRKLAIRDLIRLAGFKEQISNKEAISLKKSFANQSGEQEQDPDADDANRKIEADGSRLNYHSYMRRPQQIRWSNTETEFFYQAIRQFGTDFAMIQVLFPNRSREQVKAKFKNEQRKRPLQIADAIVHRSKDHSHFEKVIQQLQAAAEQSAKNDPSTASKDETDENEQER